MDEAAEAAKSELNTIPAEHVAAVAAWWRDNYLKAGHKRLGRILKDWSKED
jgi:hypothetical protein